MEEKGRKIRFGSVCSGIEAASIAWEPLGMVPAWFSEIEPFPCAVLEHRWPHVPNYGDMTLLEERILSGEIEAPDVLVGGTPCQAFSIAGLRRGLADDRGNLTLVFIRILNAIDKVRAGNGLPPAIVVWENVPGVLSSKDNAFGSFLAGLCGEDVALVPAGERWTNAGYVLGPRRSAGWRILDAQYFGVPQRRRRVFLVAGAGSAGVAQILFEWKGLRGNIESSKETREDVAAFPEGSFGAYRADVVAGTLKASGGSVQGGSETLVVWPVTAADNALRRLTPVECERLQGFPDNHTCIPWRGKSAEECPDGHRYKAIGNSMAVPVMRWVGDSVLKWLKKFDDVI